MPGASNFHIWDSWNNQRYARRASKNIYRILTNLSIFAYLLIFICYMLFNQQQCFIYSTASFLSKLRANKVEKLRSLVIKQLQQMTAYRKFRKWDTGIGFRNRERLFPVLPIVIKKKKKKLIPTDHIFLTCDHKHTYFFLALQWPELWNISENKTPYQIWKER